ncbi:MAG: hypothetical protein J0H15_02790 [Xanthomonadales bacterium]|nr:hypothetical protein [Xanthomonadales bacterium]
MNVHAARLATRVLAATCGALLLLAILQYAGLGSGFRWGGAAPDSSELALGDIDQQPIQLPPASAFADIAAHPLFNPDRQPTPLDAAEAGEDDVPPPSPLNVALTGVILDARNNVSIAMLQDKSTNQSIALKVGMPLEGEQASWTLVEVKPRGAVFRSAADETTEVELETSVAPPPRPAPAPRNQRNPRARGQAATANAGEPAAGTNANSDLAKRIEERRRQMREDAERMRKEAASGKSESAKK